MHSQQVECQLVTCIHWAFQEGRVSVCYMYSLRILGQSVSLLWLISSSHSRQYHNYKGMSHSFDLQSCDQLSMCLLWLQAYGSCHLCLIGRPGVIFPLGIIFLGVRHSPSKANPLPKLPAAPLILCYTTKSEITKLHGSLILYVSGQYTALHCYSVHCINFS